MACRYCAPLPLVSPANVLGERESMEVGDIHRTQPAGRVNPLLFRGPNRNSFGIVNRICSAKRLIQCLDGSEPKNHAAMMVGIMSSHQNAIRVFRYTKEAELFSFSPPTLGI